MKGMKKISRGTGFRGVLEYLFEEGKAEIVGGNVVGQTPRELAKEFGISRKMRPEIEKPVWHSSLRLPKGEKIAPEKWEAIANEYIKEMGFSDLNQWIAMLENHPDGQHIHILASRISLDGNLYLGRNENLANTRIIQDLEKKHGLQITKGLEYERDEDGNFSIKGKQGKAEKTPSRNELAMMERTGELPPRAELQVIVSMAMEKVDGRKRTLDEFLDVLKDEGVSVLPNIASTGKVSGLAFSFQGIHFKGSDLGNKFKWSAITKEIDYDQDRDVGRLKAEKAKGIVGEAPTENLSELPIQDLGSPANVGTREPEPTPTRDIGAGIGRGAEADSTSSTLPIQETILVQDEVREKGGFDATIAKRKTQEHYSKEQLERWKRTHEALGATSYNITSIDRNTGKVAHFHMTPTAIEQDISKGSWGALNAKGFDLNITPNHVGFHFGVIDDISLENLGKLKAEGYSPCLVMETSKGNFQAILKVEDRAFPNKKLEEQATNQFIRELNLKHGDPKFSGMRHAFRVPGFRNKKPERDGFMVRIHEAIQAIDHFARQKIDALKSLIQVEQRLAPVSIPAQVKTGDPAHVYRRTWEKVEQEVRMKKQTFNASAVDFQVAKRMLQAGWTGEQVIQGAWEASPDLEDRHKNTQQWLENLVRDASKELGIDPNQARSTPAAPEEGLVNRQQIHEEALKKDLEEVDLLKEAPPHLAGPREAVAKMKQEQEDRLKGGIPTWDIGGPK